MQIARDRAEAWASSLRRDWGDARYHHGRCSAFRSTLRSKLAQICQPSYLPFISNMPWFPSSLRWQRHLHMMPQSSADPFRLSSLLCHQNNFLIDTRGRRRQDLTVEAFTWIESPHIQSWRWNDFESRQLIPPLLDLIIGTGSRQWEKNPIPSLLERLLEEPRFATSNA